MKRNIENELKKYYKKKREGRRSKSLVDVIHEKFMDETIIHCKNYHLASDKVEETLNDEQKAMFHVFQIVAYVESIDKERVLIQFLLDYIEDAFRKRI